jgi:hypothetical protein
MKPKPRLEQSMQDEQVHEGLDEHWQASAAGDAICSHHPGERLGSTSGEFSEQAADHLITRLVVSDHC